MGQATRGVSGSQTNTHLFWRSWQATLSCNFSLSSSAVCGCGYSSSAVAGLGCRGLSVSDMERLFRRLIDSGWDRPRPEFRPHHESQSKLFRDDEWNEGAIIAQDNRLIHRLNGIIVCDVTDTEESRRISSGCWRLNAARKIYGHEGLFLRIFVCADYGKTKKCLSPFKQEEA